MILKGFGVIMSGALTSLAVGFVQWSWHNCWTIVENQVLIGRVRLGSVLGKHRGEEARTGV